jgi:hypothetical protein
MWMSNRVRLFTQPAFHALIAYTRDGDVSLVHTLERLRGTRRDTVKPDP